MATPSAGPDFAHARMGEVIAFPDRKTLNIRGQRDRYRQAEAELQDCVAVLDATVARLERSLVSVQRLLDTLPPSDKRSGLERGRSRIAVQIYAVRRMLTEI